MLVTSANSHLYVKQQNFSHVKPLNSYKAVYNAYRNLEQKSLLSNISLARLDITNFNFS